MRRFTEEATTDAASSDGSHSAPMIEVSGVSRVHVRGSRSTVVLDDVSATIARGEFVAVMGPSGSGKTTLLSLLGGMDRPSRGRITVGGAAIEGMPRNALAAWRSRNIGFIFQFYNLIPVLSARHNVELPLSLQGVPAGERHVRAEAALKMVGLAERAGHFPRELSGGEQQRVAIARAVVGNPDVLLCDEPTGDLDRITGVEVMRLLTMLNESYGKTIVVVSHDPSVIDYAHRVIRLEKGVIVESAA